MTDSPSTLPPEDQPPPFVVTPQPVPFTPAYGVIPTDQGPVLGVIEFWMLTGKTVLMADASTIDRMSRELADLAQKVRSTPQIARVMPPNGGGFLGPNGQPL